MTYKIQTGIENFVSENYLNAGRWSSYLLIINEIIRLKPKTVLEIGPGNFIITDILKKMNITVKTLDFDERLNPDYICDIADYNNFPEEKFDCIIAAQVFEHIKYKDYISTLKKIKKNTAALILTLPYTTKNSLFFNFNMYFPVLKQFKLSSKLIYKKTEHKFNGQHYWEIGKKGFDLKKIRKDIKQCNWKIIRRYINEQNPYHYFFILK